MTNRSRLHAGYSFVALRPSTRVHAFVHLFKNEEISVHREANDRAYPLAVIFQGMLRCFAILPCFRRASHRSYGAAAIWIGLEGMDFSKPVPPASSKRPSGNCISAALSSGVMMSQFARHFFGNETY